MGEELIGFAIDFVNGVQVTLVDGTARWGYVPPGALFLVPSYEHERLQSKITYTNHVC